MHITKALSLLALASLGSTQMAEVYLFETSQVCRDTSITLRMQVPAGPGGPCVPIPGTGLYTAGRLGAAGPDMRLKIFTYQGTSSQPANRCAAPLGEGQRASSCVTDSGFLQLITGVGVSTGNAAPESDTLDAVDAGVVAYGYVDGKTLHEIHRDSGHAAGYLKLSSDKERSE